MISVHKDSSMARIRRRTSAKVKCLNLLRRVRPKEMVNGHVGIRFILVILRKLLH